MAGGAPRDIFLPLPNNGIRCAFLFRRKGFGASCPPAGVRCITVRYLITQNRRSPFARYLHTCFVEGIICDNACANTTYYWCTSLALHGATAMRLRANVTTARPISPGILLLLLYILQAQYGDFRKGHDDAQNSKPGKWNLPFPDVSGA